MQKFDVAKNGKDVVDSGRSEVNQGRLAEEEGTRGGQKGRYGAGRGRRRGEVSGVLGKAPITSTVSALPLETSTRTYRSTSVRRRGM